MTTPVIFRKYPDGEIIAVLPTILGGPHAYSCQSYMHVGQHGACNYRKAVRPQTRPAEFLEYLDLLKELKQRGYDDLKIYSRWQRRFDEEREQAIREMRKQCLNIS